MKKVKKILVCHNNEFEWISEENINFTVGRKYHVVDETEECFSVINDKGYEEDYTKEPDEDGHSYKNWFTLVE